MNKPNLYIYIAILIGVVVLLSLAAVVLQKKQKTSITQPDELNFPTPTTVETRITKPPSIHPTQTGVLEEELPKETADLVDQKQQLKMKLPLSEQFFTVTFDYDTDKFIVELKEPKAESRVKFEEWLKASYPAIPIDRFIIK